MASWDDVRRRALSLPEVEERESRGLAQWRVRGKLFVWERPLRGSDLRALGERAPEGPILGARVEHLVAKEALLADDPGTYFTTPHFDGYPAVLVRLGLIAPDELEELVIEAWLCRAPKQLASRYIQNHLEPRAREPTSVDVQPIVSDRELVTRQEFAPLYTHAVDVRAVRGMQIDDDPSTFAEEQMNMTSRHTRIVQDEIAAGASTDQHL